MRTDLEWLRGLIRDIPDHPAPDVVFKDITPLLADPKAFRVSVDALAEQLAGLGVDHVAGIEARGFILAAPVAHALSAGFVPVRKAGKLPWETRQQAYELEYGQDHLEVHVDAVGHGDRVAVVDDVLATGGTAAATVSLIEQSGAQVAGLGVLVELAFLGGRVHLGPRELVSLISYE